MVAVNTEYSYFPDGQLAEKVVASDTEKFYWDGLALIKRDSTEYTNEPAATGGNPVMTNSEVLFNDMLGSTAGVYDKNFKAVNRTAFGETIGKVDHSLNFFTGKPEIEGLGYNFLFRNYRPELGKWQTSDPLGYPDGWNNLAYCNNWVTSCIDKLAKAIYHVVASEALDGLGHSAMIVGNDTVGYKYYSFGSGSSSSGESGGPYSTAQEAMNSLQATRLNPDGTPKKAVYDKVQAWSTKQEQDADADCYARNHIDDPYIPGWYDCLTFVYDALSAAKVDYDRWGQTPNAAFERNKQYTKVME